MLARAHGSDKWGVDARAERTVLDALIAPLLRHVDHELTGYDRPLTPADCVYCALGTEPGAPLPMLHTDTEWELFPEYAGFQLWYLLKRDSLCPSQGTLFVVDTTAGNGDDPPTCFHFLPSGEVRKARNGGEAAADADAPPSYGDEKERLATYPSLDAAGLHFRYVDIEPGDCLLMNRHQLHMSDPRPHLAGRDIDRQAISLRVVIRPPSTSTTTSFKHSRHRRHARRRPPMPVVAHASAPSYRGKALPRMF